MARSASGPAEAERRARRAEVAHRSAIRQQHDAEDAVRWVLSRRPLPGSGDEDVHRFLDDLDLIGFRVTRR